ncbi:Chaperone protein dnaJ [Entomophthora muscae]|uniref:Chaperone protein dnaJ n=1 Tax=Entomophthora muscae TaxID=34485 RepID=A0ACC2UT76_9FUNG|nr:Chaperone protein dnaJ [Entomophthora muscae]
MEVNKDEARRCLEIAKKKENNSEFDSALKFIRKSISLFPTPEAKVRLSQLEAKMSSQQSSPRASTSNGNGVPKREPTASSTTSQSTQRTDSGSASRTYTQQQVEAVKKIKTNAGDFYGILDIQKTATEGEIKKSYRKLALQFHPDKNSAPGADEAFKLVSKAFAILSDPDKRAQYDRYGGDPEQRGGGGGFRANGGHQHFGFQEEVSPEELFNMFFGGGFGNGGFGNAGFQSATFVGADGRRYVRQFGGPRTRRRPTNGTHHEGGTPFNILQLLPVLLLFGFGLLSSLFSSGPEDPSYSYSKTARYSQAQTTRQRSVNYYIIPNQFKAFKEQVKDYRLASFEREVETNYIQLLYNQCQLERNNKHRDLMSAQGFFGWGKDEKKIAEIQSRPLLKCTELSRFTR